MAGTRKSARMSERRRLEEKEEEGKREDSRKRQKTLFQRKDNVIRKNDLVVNTRLGKVAFVNPEEAPEDVKVKVETNDQEEEVEQLDHSEISDVDGEVVFVTHEVDIPVETVQGMEDPEDNRPETDDHHDTPISDSRQVDVKPEVNASQNTTPTKDQFEAQLVSLRLEMEGMKQLVKEQDQKIVHLTTELESEKKKTVQRSEEHGKTRKAEFDLLKAENIRLVESVNQLTSEVEAIKRKNEEEKNLSGGRCAQLKPKSQHVPSCVTNDNGTNITGTRTVEDPDMEAVLSRVLEYIGKDIKGLKTFRSVCRAWNQVSLRTWRNTAVIKLLPDNAPSGTGGIGGTKFLMEYQNDQSPYKLADKPYSQYKLKNLLINDVTGWNRFWELIGPFMEYVHFQNCVIANTTTDAFPKLLIDKMPNVKELALTSVKYDNFKEEDTKMPLLDRNHSQLKSLVVNGRIRINLERLLLLLPNLTSIAAFKEGKTATYDTTLDKICTAKILNPTSLPELRHMDFLNTYSRLNPNGDRTYIPRKLERLAKANLPLESFAIQVLPVLNWGEANIKPFLKSQATTLRVLKVFQAPPTDPFNPLSGCPQMNVLQELHLLGSNRMGLELLKYTPRLKLLHVSLTWFERCTVVTRVIKEGRHEKMHVNLVENVKDRMEGVVVTSLESLHIDYEFPEKSLRTLAKWTPNLKSLKTIVSGNNASAVVEGWSELKELTCLFESKIRDWNIGEDYIRSRRKTGAVISDLKKLEHFQLDCLCDASILTDVSVFHGFLKMSSLKSVQLCVSKQFTDLAEKALKQGVDYCRVIRNYTGGDHSNYGCCQRRQFDREVAFPGRGVKSKNFDSDESEDDIDVDVI